MKGKRGIDTRDLARKKENSTAARAWLDRGDLSLSKCFYIHR